MKLNQKAFSAVEALLFLILIAILGFTGFYVYNANKNTNNTYKAANQDSKGTPKFSSKKSVNSTATPKNSATSGQQYFTIKEWGVQAPYSGDLHLTYSINNLGGDPAIYSAGLSSTELSNGQPADKCGAAAGTLERAYADTVLDGAGTKASDPNSSYLTEHIGQYYYVYKHAQNLICGDISTQDKTYQAFDALLSNLAAY